MDVGAPEVGLTQAREALLDSPIPYPLLHGAAKPAR